MIQEQNGFGDRALATLNTNVLSRDNVGMEGYYHVVCRDKNGKLKWEEYVENQVVQVGKNLMFTQLLTTSIAVVGPFLGIIGVTGTSVTAGSFVVGTSYTIYSVGTTNFTLIGAANNNIGTTFTATGVGTGTGVATTSSTAFTQSGGSKEIGRAHV